MGFNDDKRRMLDALTKGMVVHEERSYQEEKNLLATGDMSEADALIILRSTPGRCASESCHHYDSSQRVWIMKPEVDGVTWYVKAYLLEENVVFLSFHKST